MATPSELFANMHNQFNVEKAKDMNATVQFDLSGDDGGMWYVNVENGTLQVNEGANAAPDATVKMAADDYVDMMTGKLNPVSAFMTGKVKVEGDLNTVMKFQTLFN